MLWLVLVLFYEKPLYTVPFYNEEFIGVGDAEYLSLTTPKRSQ